MFTVYPKCLDKSQTFHVNLMLNVASMVIDATITVSSVPAAALVYGALAPAVASASAASAWLFPGGESAVLGMALLTAEYGQIDVAPEELPASVAAILGLIVLLAVAFLSRGSLCPSDVAIGRRAWT